MELVIQIAEFRGYQTAPINNENLIVDILNNKGTPITNLGDNQIDTLISLKNKIGIGMRGSHSNRYNVVDEGIYFEFNFQPRRYRAKVLARSFSI